MTGGTASGDEPCLQSLQKVESSKSHGGREPRAMEGVCDEVREGWGRSGSGRRRRLVGTVEEVVHVASAHLGSLFMTVVGVLGGSLMGMELEKERNVDVPDAGDV